MVIPVFRKKNFLSEFALLNPQKSEMDFSWRLGCSSISLTLFNCVACIVSRMECPVSRRNLAAADVREQEKVCSTVSAVKPLQASLRISCNAASTCGSADMRGIRVDSRWMILLVPYLRKCSPLKFCPSRIIAISIIAARFPACRKSGFTEERRGFVCSHIGL